MTLRALKIPAVVRAVQATPWAMWEPKAQEFLAFLEFRAAGGLLTRDEIQARFGDRPKPVPTTKAGGIQVLPLCGVIAQRMNLMTEYSGGTSTEQFADSFDAAMADASVGTIVLDCDSPGGAVEGTPELAARIYKARGKGKKLIAVANPLMASAAYWIGSACDEIVAAPSAIGVGSIGVFCVHFDESGYDELQGFKFTVVKAGRFKAEGNPYEPLDPDALAAMQSTVNDFYSQFAGAVAKHRGVSAKDVQNGYGEGRALTAKQALAAGLVDRIDTLEGVLTKLGATNIGASGRPRNLAAVNPFGRETPGQRMRETGTHRVEVPDDSSDVTPDEPDPRLCPECGNPLDDDGTCSSCGYQAPTSTASATGGAAGDVSTLPEPTRPHEAKEHTMPGENGAAASHGADHNTIVLAERKRSADIRELGASLKPHGITDAVIEAQVNAGASIEAAALAFSSEIRQKAASTPVIHVGADRAAERNFASVGEQLLAVVRAGRGMTTDPRLHRVNADVMKVLAGATGANESVGSEGGFFLEPVLLPGIIEPVYADDPILSRITRIPIGTNSNSTAYNVVDETSRANGSRWGGIAVAFVGEGDTTTPSKPKMRKMQHTLGKLMGLGYLTEEQLEDAPQMETLIMKAFQTEVRFVLGDKIVRGLGAGEPLGFKVAKCTTTIAIEATQTIANTNTFIATNVAKLMTAMPASLWGEAIWMYNQELLPSLVTAVVGTGGSSVPVFLGAGGISGRPYDTIMGRPAFASELCDAVGTPGDLVFVAPSQYHLADKAGVKASSSVHVRFLNDEQVLKITYRVDGKPVWNSTVTPYKGAVARSPFVMLNTRT
jgi:HK97 family phage major capsid protein